jgi:hypothetical protein
MTTQSRDGEVVYAFGCHQSVKSDGVVTIAGYEETDDADIVLPAVCEDSRIDLPDGMSLPNVSGGKQPFEGG